MVLVSILLGVLVVLTSAVGTEPATGAVVFTSVCLSLGALALLVRYVWQLPDRPQNPDDAKEARRALPL
jgi:hypothetical protein